MKRIIPAVLLVVLFALTGGCIFNYNGEATIIVRNIGELAIFARVETGYYVLEVGESGTFELTWPGHDDMNINLTTYPVGRPGVGENQNFDIKDGETRTFDIAYYPEDLE